MDSRPFTKKKPESVHGENPPHGVGIDIPIKNSVPQTGGVVNGERKRVAKEGAQFLITETAQGDSSSARLPDVQGSSKKGMARR